MGSVSSAISKAALEAGVQIVTNAEVLFQLFWHDTSFLICKAALWPIKFHKLKQKTKWSIIKNS